MIEIIPNELIRMCLEELSHQQRKSVSRVCHIFAFLVATFPKIPKSYSFRIKNNLFKNPRGLDIDHTTDNIIIANSMNHRVQVFNEKDNIQFNFGSKGKSAGKFNYPVGVGINQVNGNIAIADSYNNRIQVFNNKCEYLFHFRSQENEGELICPTEVVFDGNSNFFVIDHTNQIKVFDPHGNFMYKFRSGQYMSSIAINRWERRIIISDYDSDKVKVFDQRGNFIFKFGSCGVQEGQSNGPVAIAVTEGLIVVADSGNNRVQVFDNRGQFVCMFGSEGIGNGQFKNICGVAADGQGRIITTDAVCGVQIFEPNY